MPWFRRSQSRKKLHSASLPTEARWRLEQEFLRRVYFAFLEMSVNGIIEGSTERPPWLTEPLPGWQWLLHGHADKWWLEVHDERNPELRGRPYLLDPLGDVNFFDRAWDPDPTTDATRPENLHYFLTSITTYMDENLIGQAEAIQAYQAGATPDNPPWIHTTNPA